MLQKTNTKKSNFRKKFEESIETKSLWNTVHQITKFRIRESASIDIPIDGNGMENNSQPKLNNCLANEFVFKSNFPKNINSGNTIKE